MTRAKDDERFLDLAVFPVASDFGWPDAVSLATDVATKERQRCRVERDGPWWVVYRQRRA